MESAQGALVPEEDRLRGSIPRGSTIFIGICIVVVAKESLKLLVLVRFQVSQPFYRSVVTKVVDSFWKRNYAGSSPVTPTNLTFCVWTHT